MTEPNPDQRDLGPETADMPRWVPVFIGLILVVLAGLAVVTGLRYRDEGTLTEHIGGRKRPARQASAPQEPGAGASLVLPENTPAANAPVAGSARATITGGGTQGVMSAMRITARRGMILDVKPDDAMVTVNDLPIGDVRQFDSMDEVYEFAEPGSYTVAISAPGYRERQFVVTVAENAANDVARISARLPALPSPSSTPR